VVEAAFLVNQVEVAGDLYFINVYRMLNVWVLVRCQQNLFAVNPMILKRTTHGRLCIRKSSGLSSGSCVPIFIAIYVGRSCGQAFAK
jgi:hypothetical protein